MKTLEVHATVATESHQQGLEAGTVQCIKQSSYESDSNEDIRSACNSSHRKSSAWVRSRYCTVYQAVFLRVIQMKTLEVHATVATESSAWVRSMYCTVYQAVFLRE